MNSNQKYEVIYLPAAKKDLNEIISYIQTDACYRKLSCVLCSIWK